jgi:hypothetical protein
LFKPYSTWTTEEKIKYHKTRDPHVDAKVIEAFATNPDLRYVPDGWNETDVDQFNHIMPVGYMKQYGQQPMYIMALDFG